jgi:hypothetical protein
VEHERHDVVLYDCEDDPGFRDALIDEIIVPAYMKVLDDCRAEGANAASVNTERWYDGCRVRYEFDASKGDGIVELRSVIYSVLSDITDAGASLIHNELQDSTADNYTKIRYLNEPEKLQDGPRVETFTRRTFFIDLRDGRIRVRTDLGYSVDSSDVNLPNTDNDATELDLSRESVFESGEVVEFIRSLLDLELVDQDQVKQFLNRDF